MPEGLVRFALIPFGFLSSHLKRHNPPARQAIHSFAFSDVVTYSSYGEPERLLGPDANVRSAGATARSRIPGRRVYTVERPKL